MPLPSLLKLKDEAEYREHFRKYYAGMQSPIVTHDGLTVYFFLDNFDHAFFTNSPGSPVKDTFALDRAERMMWVKNILQDPSVELYRRIMPNGKVRRIALDASIPYTVIIQINKKKPNIAKFITAYIVNSPSALTKMCSNPKW
jgi:hypothetical protein